jgi:hypothetical protein
MGRIVGVLNKADRLYEHFKMGCVWVLINLLALILAGVAFYYGRTSWNLTRDGATAEGQVIKLKESAATEDSGITYTPVISYEVYGQTHVFTSNVSSDPPAYNVGDRVNVVYEVANPAKARIDSWRELWLLPVILGISAVIVAIVINGVAIGFLIKQVRS